MFKEYAEELNSVLSLMSGEEWNAQVKKAADVTADCLRTGGKLLIAGNGGSAADAQHFAAEMVATLHKEKRRGYPAIALTTDTSFLTAWSNDFGFEGIFSRQVEALGRAGDVFIGISTSGNSENIIQAAEQAKQMGLRTICLLGQDGGRLKAIADACLIVPSKSTARIQEVHTLIIHAVCEEVIKNLS